MRDLHSPPTDNVANIIGIGLGALFRFWAYREFVFAGAALLEPANKEVTPDDREGLIPAGRARSNRGS
jgi:hypothetical protein